MTTAVCAFAILLALAGPVAAGEPFLPPKIQIAKFTCRDLLAAPETGRERALIYLSGIEAGRRKVAVFDVERWGATIDRVLEVCRAQSERSVLDVIKAEWR